MSFIVLLISLLVVLVVFGVRVTYSPAVYYALALGQFAVITLSAWKLGASKIRADDLQARRLAAAGGLLVLPFALFAWLAGFAPPWLATVHENELRYVVLLVDTFLVAGGLLVLREALSEAGERFYSTLGFAGILFGSPLYAVFVAIQLGSYRAMDRAGVTEVPPGITPLDELSVLLLFFGVVLTYLATAALAAGLGHARWVSRTASRVFTGLSLLAVLFVGIRVAGALGSVHHSLWGFDQGYEIPGFALLIPAVPWIMPALLGVLMLRKAGLAPSA